ncbi:hypothetical protein ACH5AL_24790 [Actinacidiphila glaucinigra]|uniref:hypothetical protein n=1 Tax=Actinacidiphila glaucinigra TaxID=235986 RepID=UPI0037B6708F
MGGSVVVVLAARHARPVSHLVLIDATMRLAGQEALRRRAVHLTRDTAPAMREHLPDLSILRAYLLPESGGPLPGTYVLVAAGVAVVPVPDCGHNVMPDNPERFARATAAAFSDHDQRQSYDDPRDPRTGTNRSESGSPVGQTPCAPGAPRRPLRGVTRARACPG